MPARTGPARNYAQIFLPARRNIRALCPDASATRVSASWDRAMLREARVRVGASILSPAPGANPVHYFSRRNKHFFPRVDQSPRRRVSIAPDDWKYAIGPSRECPATPRPKVLPVRAGAAVASELGPRAIVEN